MREFKFLGNYTFKESSTEKNIQAIKRCFIIARGPQP